MKIEYNRYLSFSIHYIHHENIYNKYYIFGKNSNDDIIFLDKLIQYYNKKITEKIDHNYSFNEILEIINIHLNNYNYFYNKKYRKKSLINIIDKTL